MKLASLIAIVAVGVTIVSAPGGAQAQVAPAATVPICDEHCHQMFDPWGNWIGYGCRVGGVDGGDNCGTDGTVCTTEWCGIIVVLSDSDYTSRAAALCSVSDVAFHDTRATQNGMPFPGNDLPDSHTIAAMNVISRSKSALFVSRPPARESASRPPAGARR